MASVISILGVQLSPIRKAEAITLCSSAQGHVTVVTPNPEIVVYAQRHADYKTIINQADLKLADGIGLVWAAHGLLPERVTGVDMVEALLPIWHERQYRVGIVVSESGLAQPAAITVWFNNHFPNIIVECTTTQFTTAPDVILITLGFPEQEYWLSTNAARYPATQLFMAVGGAIDFIIGAQRRAPRLFRVFGVEWLWRLGTRPQRWQRIVRAVVVFPLYIVRALIFKRSIA